MLSVVWVRVLKWSRNYNVGMTKRCQMWGECEEEPLRLEVPGFSALICRQRVHVHAFAGRCGLRRLHAPVLRVLASE